MAIFTPEYFALTAGDELDVTSNLPRVFGYYAGNIAMNEIFPLGPPVVGYSSAGFFGLRTDGSGPPLSEAQKKLPSAAPQLNRGSAIMVYGPHQTLPEGSPGFLKIYIVYLAVTSAPNKVCAYEVVWSYIQP